jgi:hypothetical protein
MRDDDETSREDWRLDIERPLAGTKEAAGGRKAAAGVIAVTFPKRQTHRRIL